MMTLATAAADIAIYDPALDPGHKAARGLVASLRPALSVV